MPSPSSPSPPLPPPPLLNIFSPTLQPFIVITICYLLFTITDGAIRMIILFHAYNQGFTAIEVAVMFSLYEVAGVVTNLLAGIAGAKWGIRRTLLLGLSLQIFSYGLLYGWNEEWTKPTAIVYVTVASMFGGIAKDLTKLGGKTVTKLVTKVSGRRQRKAGEGWRRAPTFCSHTCLCSCASTCVYLYLLVCMYICTSACACTRNHRIPAPFVHQRLFFTPLPPLFTPSLRTCVWPFFHTCVWVAQEGQDTKLFKLVSLLTGMKNSLKGVGYFVGAALLNVNYYAALSAMVSLIVISFPVAYFGLSDGLGTAKKENASLKQALSLDNRNLNYLSAARLFLFASRDFWFEVPLPFYLRSPACRDLGPGNVCAVDGDCVTGAFCDVDMCANFNTGGGCGGLGLSRILVGTFLALYIIVYGQVQVRDVLQS